MVKRTMGASVTFEAVSPEGTRYQFAHPLRVPDPKGFGIVAATVATDIHGNWVKYRYNGPNLEAAAVGVYSNNLSRIESNDGRVIDINYASDAKISSVVANGRTWRYQYDAAIPGFLLQVTLPDGRFWEYPPVQNGTYSTCSDPLDSTVTVKHPSGMRATYNLRRIFNGRINLGTTYRYQPTSCETAKPGTSPSTFEAVNYGHQSMAVFSKTLTVPGAGTYVWNYAYQQDFGATGGSFGLSATKSRTVTQPDGSQTRRYIHRLVDFQEGMIVREETLNSAAQVLESRSFTYQPSSDLWEPHAFFALGDVDRALRRIAKLTTKREIARGGDTYTTEFFYRANPQVAAYDFTQPYEVHRSSTLQSGQRITQFAYQHDTPQWLIGLPLSVIENGKMFDQYGYDGKGRIVSYDRFGTRIASYGYFASGTAAGKMNWFDDALGHRTTYDAYKRGKPQSVLRSDGNTVSQVVDDNGWVTRLTDARGTPEDYQYNTMGWLTKIDRPGIWVDTIVSYSSLGNGLVQTQTRGPERITVTLDGMIRPILERREALSGGGGSIYTKTAYDGLSRVTFRSFPSTSANPSAGVTFSYDGLGRLTQTRENVSPNATTNFAYQAGNATRLTDPLGAVTTTSRSGYGGPDDGGPTLIQRPLGVNTYVGYDIGGR